MNLRNAIDTIKHYVSYVKNETDDMPNSIEIGSSIDLVISEIKYKTFSEISNKEINKQRKLYIRILEQHNKWCRGDDDTEHISIGRIEFVLNNVIEDLM